MSSMEELFREMEPLFEATAFFSVPDGLVKGYLLVDAQGKGIDCNIYHPKYGPQFKASFFNSVHYQEPDTGKRIACRYLHEVLCVQEDGSYTNKDGHAVFKKEISVPQSREAVTERDFALIYNREKAKSGISDETFFARWFLEAIEQKEKTYKKKLSFEKQDPTTLELFYAFKNWLIKMKSGLEAKQRLRELLHCKDLVELMDKYGNGKELADRYHKGFDFAPDKERFITGQIDVQERTLKKYRCGFQYDTDKSMELGHYKRLGFDWVNNGYNATQEDFTRMAYANSLHASLPVHYHDQVSLLILSEVARGAALAFHVAFLKKQLRNLIGDGNTRSDREISSNTCTGMKSVCNRYPHCDCFHDWEEPARGIDPDHAVLFRILMKEMDHFFAQSSWIEEKPIVDKALEKLLLLPAPLQGLFVTKLSAHLELQYGWKVPEPSDLARIKKALQGPFYASYDLSYFLDKNNIPNQELVGETLTYFRTGAGKRAFEPLPFLNLLNKQYHFVHRHLGEGSKVVRALKALPFTELEKHILLGLLIKWFGGYPVHALDEAELETLKGLQQEFLSFEGETPEKEFCKADRAQRTHFMKLGLAFTAGLNHHLDVAAILKAMDAQGGAPLPPKRYQSFDDLFRASVVHKALGPFKDQQSYLLARSSTNFQFNIWLQELKGWEYGNEDHYQTFLTKETFQDFLRFQREEEKQKLLREQQEVQSWKIEDNSGANKPGYRKPVFDEGTVTQLLELLKGYFGPDQHALLQKVLQGRGTGEDKLIFLGNGNALADAFKKLFEHRLITGCQKQDLELWIQTHFQYQPAGVVKSFTRDYVHKHIARKNWYCKNPVIEIMEGKIARPEPPGKKKR